MALLTLLAGRPCRDDEHAERMREIYVVVGGGGVRWAAAVGGVHGRRKTRFTIVQSMQTGHLPRLPVTGHARLTLHIICATVAAINIIFTGPVVGRDARSSDRLFEETLFSCSLFHVHRDWCWHLIGPYWCGLELQRRTMPPLLLFCATL